MSISRKQFLRNAGLLLGGTTLLKQNIFAKSKSEYKATTCLYDLFSTYDYTNSPYPFAGSQVTASYDISYAKSPVNTNCKDVQYADENTGCALT